MKRGRRLLKQVVVCALVLAGLALLAPKVVAIHVRKVTGRDPAPTVFCPSCHYQGGGRWAKPREIYPNPIDLAVSPDGKRVFVACAGNDEVIAVDPERARIVRRIATTGGPHGLALSPDGERLYVALGRMDRVARFETDTGDPMGTLAVGRAPRGLRISPDGGTIVVANSVSDDVSIIDALAWEERARLEAGREPYGVTISPDGRHAFVANRLTSVHDLYEVPESEVTVLDLVEATVERRLPLVSSHLSEGVAATPDGLGLVPLVRVRNLVPIAQVAQGWVMTSGLGVWSPDGGVRQFPLDEINAYFSDPSAVVVDPSGKVAYVASGGGDCVTVVDLDRIRSLAAGDDTPPPGRWANHLGVPSEYVLGRIPTGPNPRSLAISPDGRRLFVGERLGDAVAIVDTATREVVDRVVLRPDRDLTPERRGEIVFHRAEITFQGQFACRSCHPDGHVDGLAYDFAIDGLGRNILDNRSLQGIADTAPFKWNGKNKNLHEQCGPRFARVLTLADPFTDDQLDDLVAFIESMPPPPPPEADEAIQEARMRGKEIFDRTHTNKGEEIPVEDRCVTCHRPPLFTNRLPSKVGTKAASDASDEFDTPHLLGIGASAPYLHDGRARTLESIWTIHAPDDTHGVVNDLTKRELNDLVEYLKSL